MANEIIIFSRSLPFHHLGGMEVVAWDMAVKLQIKGFDVTVVTTDFNHHELNIPNGPRIIRIKNIPVASYSKGWWRETNDLALTWTDKKNVCAVISVSAGAFAVLKHRNLFPNAKFIMQAHGTSMGELISKIKTKKIKKIISSFKNVLGFLLDARHYNHFDSIVAVGDSVYQDMKKRPTKYICKNTNVTVIENGIDQGLFVDGIEERSRLRNELGISEQSLVFISASRLHEQKGVDTNIELFSDIKKNISNAKYIICGDGPDEENLRRKVISMGLTNDIIFYGAQSRHDLAKTMQCADVFLFLTRRIEGLPLNVLEAMSAGLPMIISEHLAFKPEKKMYRCDPFDLDISGILKFLSDNQNGIRKSYIPKKNTLNYSVEQYISLFKVNEND